MIRVRVGALSLGRRIVASVALGLALVLLLFGLVALWTIRESTEAAYRQRVALAQVLAGRVDDALHYALETLEREAATLRIEPGLLTEDQRHRLVELRLRLGVFTIVSLADADGRTLWTDPSRAGILIGSPLAHPSVQGVLLTGKPQITEFPSPAGFPSEAGGDTVFACLAVPVHDPNERLAGVLMAELDPAHPALRLLPSREAEGGIEVQLMNSAGQVLAVTGERYPGTAAEHQALLARLMMDGTPGYRVHQPPPAMEEPIHVVAYAPVSLLPPWGIVLEQPKDLVLALPRQLQQRLTLLGGVALLLAATVAWLDVRRVVRPLKQLTTAAERFAAGQLDEAVHLDRADELGILARAWETMRQRLRASLTEVAAWNRELEQRVTAATDELNVRNRELVDLYGSLQVRERERAELLQRLMAGQEEERRRLAQELHDETSQALASLQLGLERLAAAIEKPEEARDLAAQLRGVAAQTLADVHRLAVELRPSVLDDVGLVAAIGRYLEECAVRWALILDFAPIGLDHLRLIPAAETAIYRVVQSALINVFQHAQAQHVSIVLERRAEKLVVVIEDDGQGFDLGAVRAAPLERRLGLAGMEERAALIGAALTIEAAPGAGTTVFLEVPLAANCRREEASVETARPAG